MTRFDVKHFQKRKWQPAMKFNQTVAEGVDFWGGGEDLFHDCGSSGKLIYKQKFFNSKFCDLPQRCRVAIRLRWKGFKTLTASTPGRINSSCSDVTTENKDNHLRNAYER